MSIWTDLLLFHGYVVSPGTLALLMKTRAAADPGETPEPAPREPEVGDGAVKHPPHPLRAVGQLR